MAAIAALNSFLEPVDAFSVPTAGMRMFHFLKILLIRSVLFSKPLKFNYKIQNKFYVMTNNDETTNSININRAAVSGRR